MVQHSCTGTGGFDGVTEQGRAGVTMPGPISTGNVLVRAKVYGSAPNAYQVSFVDAGAGMTVTTTTVLQSGTNIVVTLRRSSSAILATADEVAAVINAVTDAGFPIVADAASGSPTVCQAVAPTSLTGGLDAGAVDLAGLQFRSTFANINSGVFVFENFREVVHVRGVQTTFNLVAPAHLKVSVVNLTPGLAVISGSGGPVVDFDLSVSPANDLGLSDMRVPVLPYQALVVQCFDGGAVAQPGLVKIWAERIGPNLLV